MLDLFVIGGHQPNSDFVRAVTSFNGRIHRMYSVDNMSEINRIEKESEWYGVIYDNETIQEELLEALPVFFEQSKADVLIAYRGNDDNSKPASKGPRFFREGVILSDKHLNVDDEEGLVFDTILNGWVLNNVST